MAGDWEQGEVAGCAGFGHSAGDAYARIRNLYKLMAEGHSLKSAAEIAEGRASAAVMDRAAAVGRFNVQKMEHGRAIKPISWDRSYGPALAAAVPLLTGRKPVSIPANSMDPVIRLWPPGSKERQVRAQSLAQFLRYCVTREQFPALWMPPTDLSSHVGAKGTHRGTIKKGDPMADQQIINLITSLPLDGPGCRWGDAPRLMAELGLSPHRTNPPHGADLSGHGSAVLVVHLPEAQRRR